MASQRCTSKCLAVAAVCGFAVGGCGGRTTEPTTSANVPRGARLVDVVSAVAAQKPIVGVSVTDPAKVRQIVAWINQMHRVRPGVAYACPLSIGVEPTVTLTFRAQARGAVLARASETDYGFGSGPCNPVNINVPGRDVRSLLGGRLLERLQRLFSVSFGFGLGEIKGQIYFADGPAPPNGHRKGPVSGAVSLYLTHNYPGYGSGPVSKTFLPRPGQFTFTPAPGRYLLSASASGKRPDCPRTTVVVRVGRTTRADVPIGCSIP
jgi:hypothetical protein